MVGFEDIFGQMFGEQSSAQPTAEDKPLPKIRGFRERGVLYVRAEDVADALEAQAPKTNERLIRKLRS